MSDTQRNYTKEEEELLHSLYEELGTERIQEVADRLNRPVKSVISKLVNLKIYQPLPKVASKRKTYSKKQLLNELEDIVGFDTTGFNGSTKQALSHLIQYLKSNPDLK